jgi:phosphinothricin acetyltransferase
MRVRLAEAGDAPAIGAIYNLEVQTSTVTSDLVPWTGAEMAQWLSDHWGAHPAVVATGGLPDTGDAGTPRGARGEAVLGFGALSPYRPRPAYAGTVETSVYVGRSSRGQGVGTALLRELVRLAQAHGFHTMVARIVGPNDASVALHAACGFEPVGIEREVCRKHRQWLDVIELQRML